VKLPPLAFVAEIEDLLRQIGEGGNGDLDSLSL
jgi:hypothetical protein